jgi:hypothetical protein
VFQIGDIITFSLVEFKGSFDDLEFNLEFVYVGATLTSAE